MSENIVDKLRYLVSLNEPENGGPYQGHAAAMCGEAMQEAAEVITDLLAGVKLSAAVISAIYEWLARVEKAGGATSISGISECNAMLKSLRKNADRTDSLVLRPLARAIERAEGK